MLKNNILKNALFAFVMFLYAGASPLIAQQTMAGQDMSVFAPNTGNPVIPAYLADATMFYDSKTDAFYAYGTNDGAGGGNVYPTQMWFSKDCRRWENRPLTLPKQWTEYAGTKALWAPSFIYYPPTDKYYLMYGIDCKTFVAMSDSPFGPWADANAVAPGRMLYKGYDGQFFLDDDNTMYITTDNGFFKIMKLRFDDAGRVAIDCDDLRFTESDSNEFVGTYKYKKVEGIRNMFEASYIYKRNGLYYLMWSYQGSENYNVRYAVSENITGPYRELNGSMDKAVLERDDLNAVLGPGHHSMFDYDGRTFIVYHRQHFPFVDSKRQTCIDEVFFASDGSIKEIMPTHKGVEVVSGATRFDGVDLAFGKPTRVSSARVYDASPYDRRYRTPNAKFVYDGRWAVDENYGTRWDPGVGAKQPWLMVDLGKDFKIRRTEILFEFTSRTYHYKVEYLPACEAENMDDAASLPAWHLFADRIEDGAMQSPVTDVPVDGKPVKARYMRLTIVGADLPPTADEADRTNADNSLSVFEFRVF